MPALGRNLPPLNGCNGEGGLEPNQFKRCSLGGGVLKRPDHRGKSDRTAPSGVPARTGIQGNARGKLSKKADSSSLRDQRPVARFLAYFRLGFASADSNHQCCSRKTQANCACPSPGLHILLLPLAVQCWWRLIRRKLPCGSRGHGYRPLTVAFTTLDRNLPEISPDREMARMRRISAGIKFDPSIHPFVSA